ncbi:MAG: hypothetical protein K0Q46_3640 [Rhodococcus erythropolis]|nr:hypothetical protein [Rhodococcus erythropolis]
MYHSGQGFDQDSVIDQVIAAGRANAYREGGSVAGTVGEAVIDSVPLDSTPFGDPEVIAGGSGARSSPNSIASKALQPLTVLRPMCSSSEEIEGLISSSDAQRSPYVLDRYPSGECMCHENSLL